jgi:hypothetical protein
VTFFENEFSNAKWPSFPSFKFLPVYESVVIKISTSVFYASQTVTIHQFFLNEWLQLACQSMIECLYLLLVRVKYDW